MNKSTIWIDLDNTPHVPFFEPIIGELSRRGVPVLVTARDAFQVCDLADKKGMSYMKVGRHHGKNAVRKILGLFGRAAQLAPIVLRRKPALAVSHGSRAQVILANFLGIPSLTLVDYEYAKWLPTMRPKWVMVPEVIPTSSIHCRKDRILKYPGIKEDVYVPFFQPEASLKQDLNLRDNQIIVTARPPAGEAHYHRPESDVLFVHFMGRALSHPDVKVILLPRNAKQGEQLRHEHPDWFEHGRTVIPGKVIDGLSVLWYSDLVVSGGGTMNREAVALGIPVFSVFRGTIGAVDHFLAKEGKMILLENVADIDAKVEFKKRSGSGLQEEHASAALNAIVDAIQEIVAKS